MAACDHARCLNFILLPKGPTSPGKRGLFSNDNSEVQLMLSDRYRHMRLKAPPDRPCLENI